VGAGAGRAPRGGERLLNRPHPGQRVDGSHADVTYSLLLDDAAVLDHLPGAAVQVNGRWVVTRRTYCDVSTQGVAEIPPPCR
jgi:hypothetical protein